jgi:ABC-type antimicrobial peptide transport system permease subunit
MKLDASVPIYDIQTVHGIVSDQSRSHQVITGVLSGFAAVALLLVALGIYGVLAASVAQRTREIGIRMAMGACAGSILGTVLGHGLKLTIIGLALGLCGSLVLSRSLERYLLGVAAQDAVTLVLVAAILTGTALLACWIPARRAAKIDPMEALRYE